MYGSDRYGSGGGGGDRYGGGGGDRYILWRLNLLTSCYLLYNV